MINKHNLHFEKKKITQLKPNIITTLHIILLVMLQFFNKLKLAIYDIYANKFNTKSAFSNIHNTCF